MLNQFGSIWGLLPQVPEPEPTGAAAPKDAEEVLMWNRCFEDSAGFHSKANEESHFYDLLWVFHFIG